VTAIAFITEPKPTRLDSAEDQVIEALKQMGHQASYLPWDAPLSRLKEHDLLVVKTAYNYYRALSEFTAFLDRAQGAGLAMVNSPELVRWNMEKTYLKELEAKGFSPPPTMWLPAQSTLDLKSEMEKRGWEKVVLKPTISAGSYQTWVTTPGDIIDVEDDFRAANRAQAYMMQRYMAETVSEGEWSLVFLEGALSHTVLKTPKAGDFRVQKQYGGQYQKKNPPAAAKALAEKLIARLPEVPLYGRVDGVMSGGQFYLMELELIEPDLYLAHCPEVLPRYAAALSRRAG
jgi:glutathione synthase/RimK-type ligase-like ATP-grasp enzyme